MERNTDSQKKQGMERWDGFVKRFVYLPGRPVRKGCLLSQAEGRPKFRGLVDGEKFHQSQLTSILFPVQLVIYEAMNRNLEGLGLAMLQVNKGASMSVLSVIWQRALQYALSQDTKGGKVLNLHCFPGEQSSGKSPHCQSLASFLSLLSAPYLATSCSGL